VRLGSRRDNRAKAISPATDGRSENPGVRSVRRSNGERYLYPKVGRISDLLMWDAYMEKLFFFKKQSDVKS